MARQISTPPLKRTAMHGGTSRLSCGFDIHSCFRRVHMFSWSPQQVHNVFRGTPQLVPQEVHNLFSTARLCIHNSPVRGCPAAQTASQLILLPAPDHREV